VFHNDVIAVGNEVVLFCHESAFVEQDALLTELSAAVGAGFTPIVVRAADVSVERAVTTYLFNSQLFAACRWRHVAGRTGRMRRGPIGRRLSGATRRRGRSDTGNPDLRSAAEHEKRRRPGVPATACRTNCRRARSDRGERVAGRALHAALVGWVEKNYRDRLAPADLADPALLVEGRRALDELSALLGLGNVYPFQRDA
jgi:succinylarginine dihydrolase